MKTSVLKFGMEHKGFLAACCRKWEKYKADRIERKFLKENPRRLSRQDSEKILKNILDKKKFFDRSQLFSTFTVALEWLRQSH